MVMRSFKASIPSLLPNDILSNSRQQTTISVPYLPLRLMARHLRHAMEPILLSNRRTRSQTSVSSMWFAVHSFFLYNAVAASGCQLPA